MKAYEIEVTGPRKIKVVDWLGRKAWPLDETVMVGENLGRKIGIRPVEDRFNTGCGETFYTTVGSLLRWWEENGSPALTWGGGRPWDACGRQFSGGQLVELAS